MSRRFPAALMATGAAPFEPRPGFAPRYILADHAERALRLSLSAGLEVATPVRERPEAAEERDHGPKNGLGRSSFGRAVCYLALQRPAHRADLGWPLTYTAVHRRCDRMRIPGTFCMIVGFEDAPELSRAWMCAPFCMNPSLEDARPLRLFITNKRGCVESCGCRAGRTRVQCGPRL